MNLSTLVPKLKGSTKKKKISHKKTEITLKNVLFEYHSNKKKR